MVLGLFAGFEILAFGCRLAGGKKEVKKETKLGMAYKKDDNFGEWYSEVRRVLILSVLFPSGLGLLSPDLVLGVLPIRLTLFRWVCACDGDGIRKVVDC